MANYPTRFQQREHSPEEENEKINKQFRYSSPDSYDFYDRQIDLLQKQLEYRPFLSRLLFNLIYVVIAVGILYTWYQFDTVFPIIVSFLHKYLILMILYVIVASFHYPIYVGKTYKLYFRPLNLTWKAISAVEIRSSPGELPRISTLLHNMSFLTMYQVVDFDNQQTKLVISATQPLIFARITAKKLYFIMSSVLSSTRVIFEATSIPSVSFQHFHFLKTNKLYLQLDVLVRQLLRAEVSGKLMIAVKNHKDVIDRESLKLDTLYELHIGFSTSNLDRWMGLINTISQDVRHRPFLSYLLDHYFPRLWIFLVRLLHLPGFSWYSRYISRNLVYADKLEQGFKFPRFDYHSPQIFGFRNPGYDIQYDYQLGNLVEGGVLTKDFGIPIQDLAQGGIITGAIGTGKTTLRLHLMYQALINGLRVIDFDLKGDATRYGKLASTGKVIIPNRNFHLNPFFVPKGFSTREYSNIVLQSFVETIPSGEELSPPQLHLLTRAIYKTVEEGGNARKFFKNLYLIGHQEQQIVDNNQQNTAQALITRFDWMQTVMHNIFWQSSSSLQVTDFAESNLFFDLSQLEMTATRSQIRFLINLIMARVIASLRHRKQRQLSDIIFLDETQILMPRRRDNAELTKLEQTVTTLRYKGVSVIATGVSAALMSPVLLDVGFVAQFRSENAIMENALGISADEANKGLITQLPPYHALIRSNSIGSRPIMLHTRPFEFDESLPAIKMPDSTPLARFELDYVNIWQSRLDAVIISTLGLSPTNLAELQVLASKFVNREFSTFEIQQDKLITLMKQTVEKIQKQMKSGVLPPLVINNHKEFVSLVIYAYMLATIKHLQYDSRLNLLDKNLENLVSAVLKALQPLTGTAHTIRFDAELMRLKGYIQQIEEFSHLDMTDIAAVTVEMASLLENLSRSLGIDVMGLTANLSELAAGGWLNEAEHRLLTRFVRTVRNPVVHGTFEFQQHHISLIYRCARLVLKKIELYRHIDAELQHNFDISAHQSPNHQKSSSPPSPPQSSPKYSAPEAVNHDNLAIDTSDEVNDTAESPDIEDNDNEFTKTAISESADTDIDNILNTSDNTKLLTPQQSQSHRGFDSSTISYNEVSASEIDDFDNPVQTGVEPNDIGNILKHPESSEIINSDRSQSHHQQSPPNIQNSNNTIAEVTDSSISPTSGPPRPNISGYTDPQSRKSSNSTISAIPKPSSKKMSYRKLYQRKNPESSAQLSLDNFLQAETAEIEDMTLKHDDISSPQPLHNHKSSSTEVVIDDLLSRSAKQWRQRLETHIFADFDQNWLKSFDFRTIELEALKYVRQRFTYYSVSLNDITKALHQTKVKIDHLAQSGIIDPLIQSNISAYLHAVLLFYYLGYLDRITSDNSKISEFEGVYTENIIELLDFIQQLCQS